MSGDLVEVARTMVDAMERADVATVRATSSERLANWDPAPWITGRWRPRLDEIAGPGRTITAARQVNDNMARVVLNGRSGQAYVSVVFDDVGAVAGLSMDEDEQDGRFATVVGCTREQRDEMQAFYEKLTDGRIGFGEGRGALPPRWGDPTRPTQIHFDMLVPDLDAAEHAVLENGAAKLDEFPTWRVFADPVGHPFCLYAGDVKPTDRLGTMARIVLDCADPAPLARFWGGLLDMQPVEESADRVVVGRADGSLPMIAAQRVADYQPPRWPDPEYPAQMHFDIGYDDRPRKERLALSLGATLLPPQGGSCPVYADPAGHPFCMCYKGE